MKLEGSICFNLSTRNPSNVSKWGREGKGGEGGGGERKEVKTTDSEKRREGGRGGEAFRLYLSLKDGPVSLEDPPGLDASQHIFYCLLCLGYDNAAGAGGPR